MPRRDVEARLTAGVLVAVTLAVGVFVWLSGWRVGADSAVCRAGALTFLHGDRLYSPQRLSALPSWVSLPFTYPPAAALLCVPLAALPSGLTWGVVCAASVLSLVVVIRLCARPATLPVVVPTLCALALEPVWKTLFLGQINLVLMALVIVDVLSLVGSRVAGVLTGVAAAIKLTPLIFVAHLFVTERRRDGLRALGTFLGLQAVMFGLLPRDAISYWTDAAFDPNRVGGVHWIFNQSLNGMLARASRDAVWSSAVAVLIGMVLAVCSGWLVRRLHGRGETLGAVLVTGFLGLLVSPVSWSHHWIWAVLLVVRGWWWWAAAVVGLFASCVVMLVLNGGVSRVHLGPWRLDPGQRLCACRSARDCRAHRA